LVTMIIAVALVTTVTSGKYSMWCNHGNPTVLHKQYKPTVQQGSSHKFEPQPF
jgi:hypothetical protein